MKIIAKRSTNHILDEELKLLITTADVKRLTEENRI